MMSEPPQPTLYRLTAARQVWSMPELVGIIASNADQSTLGRLARVNKTISNVALAILYRTVSTNFYDLIKILSPTKLTPDHGLSFTRPLKETDWTRFLRYTKYVNGLVLEKVDASAEIFCVMDATRPSEDIFPSLKSFSCDSVGRTNYLTKMIFHNRLTNLEIKAWEPPLRLLQNIRTIACSLQILRFTDKSLILDALTHAELICLLPAISSIVHIELPPTFFTTKIFDILAQKQHLRIVRIPKLDEWAHGAMRINYPDFEYGFRFPDSGFPTLEALIIADASPQPHRRISITSEFKSLHDLEVKLSGQPSYANVQKYFQVLTHGFTSLTRLVLDLSAKHETYNSEATFSMLEPLLSLSGLRSFYLANYKPMSLADRHIEQMSRSWPLLRNFCFPGRMFFEHTELTLSALVPFIENCKFLEDLRLCIDASIKPPRELTDELIFPKHFKKLHLLDSTPGEVNDVAAYIADILPNETQLRYQSTESEMLRARMDKWRAISDLVDLIRKAKSRALRRG
ncbi:hypothetical protein SISSUDRAFT_1119455 [Sistotremastrum suecicum HHB10207 ss-3]|uniref:F-box domain-containing protein n=1 Tax=Sistotremastrum suecicum HHB10207 ss-3 TaxID=1314776 RepID=A0A166DNT7_9AGAM|nr:hypothetical protein SISSUDRAFT_1119455 [Sistotremastrum suecicum HHB10207 ss-3]